MTTTIRKASRTEPEARCLVCHHLEREHGATGTRPCLMMTGDLLDREFCKCDRFRGAIRKVA
jgi:hypothetical protein